MGKRSQASFEFISIFVIAFLFLVIIGGFFFKYIVESRQSLDQKQIEKIGGEIISNVEKIYFLGRGNRVTINANFPEGIANFTLNHFNLYGNEYDIINITVFRDKGTTSHIFDASELYIRFNCTACYQTVISPNLTVSSYNESAYVEGPKFIRIESRGEWVSIDFMQI